MADAGCPHLAALTALKPAAPSPVRRVREDRRAVGPPAHLPGMRRHALLRQLAEPYLPDGLRPSDSPTRSLAGAPCPAPFAWLTSLRSFARDSSVSSLEHARLFFGGVKYGDGRSGLRSPHGAHGGEAAEPPPLR